MHEDNQTLRILLLCDRPPSIAATVLDHIEALSRYSRHDVKRMSMLRDLPKGVDLNRFDVIIIHYTLMAADPGFMSAAARAQLAGCRALKAVFIQDEYRYVDRSIAAMKAMGIGLLFTCVPTGEIEKVYPEAKLPGVKKFNVLTGYVPENLLEENILPIAQRKIDIGYRSRKVASWLGELGQEKWQIGHRILEDAAGTGLVIDISFREQDRLYGRDWVNFVGNCKAMLGVESGASVFDFDGEVQRAVEAHERRDPSASFVTLRDLYFANLEGKINLAQISPRCFEAAALGTLMILYEGAYSGILEPWTHYAPLKKDHSNFVEIVTFLHNEKKVSAVVDRARRHIALNPDYSYRGAVGYVDTCLENSIQPEMRSVMRPYGVFEFKRTALFDFRLRFSIAFRNLVLRAHRFAYGPFLEFFSPQYRGTVVRLIRGAGRLARGSAGGASSFLFRSKASSGEP